MNLDIAGVKSALKKAANPNAASLDPRPLTPLGAMAIGQARHRGENVNAEALEVGRVLFSNGAKISRYDRDILFFPIVRGNVQLISILLDRGASPTAKIEGYTPAELALKYQQTVAYSLLISRGAIPVKQSAAAQLALVEAASTGDVAEMKKAIEAGAYINGADSNGRTALINAVREGIFDRKQADTVSWLLDHGADSNQKGESGFEGLEGIPLQIFVLMNSATMQEKRPEIKMLAEETFARLLKAGAKVSRMDSQGRTALHFAAQADNVRAAEILISEGARIMARDKHGKTPLDFAESGSMIRLLKKNGATEH